MAIPLILAVTVAITAQEGAPRINSIQDVNRIVERHFATLPGHTPGELITQKMGQELFKKLAKAGWTCPHEKDILERMLDEGEFLVTVLGSPKGQEFLSKIRGYPDGIDRIDRMSRLPQGRDSVTDLIHKVPNGHKWIEALTTTEQGIKVGESLSKAELGKDFNQPTGRIYYAEQLSKYLSESYNRSRTKTVTNQHSGKK
jgi:hypothetical protein